jgi:hypothetical protein
MPIHIPPAILASKNPSCISSEATESMTQIHDKLVDVGASSRDAARVAGAVRRLQAAVDSKTAAVLAGLATQFDEIASHLREIDVPEKLKRLSADKQDAIVAVDAQARQEIEALKELVIEVDKATHPGRKIPWHAKLVFQSYCRQFKRRLDLAESLKTLLLGHAAEMSGVNNSGTLSGLIATTED